MDPEKNKEDAFVLEVQPLTLGDNQDERRVSFGSNVSDQSSNMTKARKRTLYSQALVKNTKCFNVFQSVVYVDFWI